MKKDNIAEIHPLSIMQESLLIHSLSGSKDQGFLQVKCKYKGNLDYEKFKQAWIILFDKHKALRTSIHWEKISKPIQVVHKNVELNWVQEDFAHQSTSDQEIKIDELITEDRASQLDFTKAPISRFYLIRLSDQLHFMLWTCHHIMVDGWSSYHAIESQLQIYEQLVNGTFVENQEATSFFDYLKWVKNQDMSKVADFWHKQLYSFDIPTIISTSQSTRIVNSAYQTISFSISEGAAANLKSFVKKHKVSLNTLFQGVWALAISKYLSREDVVFGATVNGRSHTGFKDGEDIIGMLMNVIPVRVSHTEEEDFINLLQRLQSIQYASMEYEYVGLGQILELSDSPLNVNLFDSLYIFQNFRDFNLNRGGIEIVEATSSVTSTYPITIIVNPANTLEITIKFNGDIPDSIAKCFLDGIENSISKSISQNDMLSVQEVKESFEFPKQVAHSLDLKTTEDGTNVFRRHQRNIEGTTISKLQRRNLILDRDQAPGNTTQLNLSQLWEELFGWYPIGIRENFFDIGGTSIMAVQLFAQIEKFFSVNMPTSELFSSPTIEELARRIEESDKREGWGSLVPLRKKGSRNPLFCIHAGGAHVLFYQDLAKNLSDDQPVYAIQPLGLDGVKKAHESIQEMAAYYIDEIRKIQPKGPYALLGTCFSDAVGIEMARQLLEQGEIADPLMIVDSTPSGDDFEKVVEKERLEDYWDIVSSGNYKFVFWAIRKKLQSLIDRFRYSGNKKKASKLDYSQIGNLDVIRNNMTNLYNKYDWQSFDGKVTYILTDGFGSNPWSDYLVKRWSKIARKGVDSHKVPGRHFSIFEEPEVKGLASKIEECLNHK